MSRTTELRWAVQDREGDEVARFWNRQEAEELVEELGISDMRVLEIERERPQ
jgi:hypothetical protein